jgi:hypothetical protein
MTEPLSYIEVATEMTIAQKRLVILCSLAVAVIGFLSVNQYFPQFGVIFNVMNDQIGLCFGDIGDRTLCDIIIPYRLVLAVCFLVIIVAVAVPNTAIKSADTRSVSPPTE